MFFRRKPEPRPTRRGPYRSQLPDGQQLTAILAAPSGRTVGQLVDISARDLCVRLTADVAERLSPEDIVEVTLQSSSNGTVMASARVARLEADGPNHVRCGMDLVEPQRLLSGLSGYFARLFNRRRSARVRPSLDRRVPVGLAWEGGEVQARIHDISTTGLGLSLPLVEAYRLMTVSDVRVRFRLPQLDEVIEGGARIVNRKTSEGVIMLGLEFDLEEPEGVARHQAALEQYIAQRAEEIARWSRSVG